MNLHHILLAASMFALSASAQVVSETDDMQQVINSLSNRLDRVETTANRLQQQETWRRIFRKGGHFNLSFGTSTITCPDYTKTITGKNFAIDIQSGRSFYLHRRPIGGVAKIGLDWDWIDLGLANNTTRLPNGSTVPGGVLDDYYSYNGPARQDLAQIRLGMGAGLSLHIAPFANIDRSCRYLRFYGYFHVVPSLNVLGIDYIDDSNKSIGEDNWDYRFVPFFSAGGGFAWKVISLGYESTWGSAKYEVTDFLGLPEENLLLRSSSSRIVLSFRF